MNNQPPQTHARVAAAILIAAVVVSAAILASTTLYPAKTISRTTTVTDTFAQTLIALTTTTSISCGGPYPICPANAQTFTLSVNYTGSWRVAYQGYDTAGCSNCNNNASLVLRGSYDGSGFNSRNITVTAQGYGWTLCAQAQKFDSSNSVLVLHVSGAQNETSLPFGTTSACVEALIA